MLTAEIKIKYKTFDYKEKTLELTLDEAKQIFSDLNLLLGKTQPIINNPYRDIYGPIPKPMFTPVTPGLGGTQITCSTVEEEEHFKQRYSNNIGCW